MRKLSVLVQLILILFLVSAIPTCISIYQNSRETLELFEKEIAESTLSKLQANKDLCDELLSGIIYNTLDMVLMKQYSELEGIQSYEVLNSDYKYVMAANNMKENLSKITNRDDILHSAYYYMNSSDYVISTDKGLVPITQYWDMSWQDEAMELMQGPEGIWYQRNLNPDSSGAAGDAEDIISYVYRLSSLYTSTKGIIVVNIYEEGISNLISAYAEDEVQVEGLLIDGNGDVIASSSKVHLYSNLSYLDYTDEIIGQKNTSGYNVTNVNDSKILYTYQKSDLYDWTYINLYSLDEIFAESNQVVRTGMLTTLVVILIGVICAVLVSFKIILPIRRLVKEIGAIETGEESKSNEIEYLEKAFIYIREREKVLMEKVSLSEQSIGNAVLTDMLQGGGLKTEDQKRMLTWFPHNHFMVAILFIDNWKEYLKRTTNEEREIIRYRISEMATMVFPEAYKTGSGKYRNGSVAIIMNFQDYDSVTVKNEVFAAMKELQKKCREEQGLGLSIGISQVHRYLDSASLCAEEAHAAAERRLILGRGCISSYQKIDEKQIQTYQSYQNEKRIVNYLEIGDFDSIQKELIMMKEGIELIRYISIDNIMLVFNQLAGITQMYLNKHNYNAALVLGEKHNLFSEFAEFETLDEIIEYFQNIYERIVKYQREISLDDEAGDYCKAVLKYIKVNYQTDIDFEELAAKIGISYSYLRKVVKEETGKSLLENVNILRVEEAKKMLGRLDLTVEQVAEAVGYHNKQSLARFFQKYEGISPRAYRDKISE